MKTAVLVLSFASVAWLFVQGNAILCYRCDRVTYDECRHGPVKNCSSVYFDSERDTFGRDFDCCFVTKMRGIIGKVSVDCDISSRLPTARRSCSMPDCFIEACFQDLCLPGTPLSGSD